MFAFVERVSSVCGWLLVSKLFKQGDQFSLYDLAGISSSFLRLEKWETLEHYCAMV